LVRSRARRRYLNEILKARYLSLDDAARFEVVKGTKSAPLRCLASRLWTTISISWAAGPDES